MKLNLSVNKIATKEFSTKAIKGYNTDEVDEFLNLIIEDYETIAEYIKDCKETIKKLRDENYQLKKARLNNDKSNITNKETLELLKENKVNDVNNDEKTRLDKLEAKIERIEKLLEQNTTK